jgi:CspA family cold shock protein
LKPRRKGVRIGGTFADRRSFDRQAGEFDDDPSLSVAHSGQQTLAWSGSCRCVAPPAWSVERWSTMARGSVVRLIRDRGFGFIRTPDGSEIFFHHSTLPPGVFDSLTEGQELEYEVEQDTRGRGERARDVRLV